MIKGFKKRLLATIVAIVTVFTLLPMTVLEAYAATETLSGDIGENIFIYNGDVYTVSGTATILNGFRLEIASGGMLTVNGTLTNNGVIFNYGTIDGSGTIVNNSNSLVCNGSDASLIENVKITNYQTVQNSGTIKNTTITQTDPDWDWVNNEPSGVLDNVTINGGAYMNLGEIKANCNTTAANYKHQIYWDANGGVFTASDGSSSSNYYEPRNDGDTIYLPTPGLFTRAGYVLVGWSTSPSGPVNVFGGMFFTSNARYYAIWESTGEHSGDSENATAEAGPSAAEAAAASLSLTTVTAAGGDTSISAKPVSDPAVISQLFSEAKAVIGDLGLAAKNANGKSSAKVYGAFAVKVNAPASETTVATFKAKNLTGKKMLAMVKKADGSVSYMPVDVDIAGSILSVKLPSGGSSVVLVEYTPVIAASNGNVTTAQLRQVFNAAYYAAMNPDVVAALGNSNATLFNHFVNHGFREGRASSPQFDILFYQLAYPDLQAAFGNDLGAYVRHYLRYGANEKRTSGIGN